MSKNLVNLSILIAVIGLAVGAGFFYLSSDSRQTQGVVSQGPSALGSGDQGISTLRTLLTLREVDIDLSLFDDARFKNLIDYSTQLPTIGRGRENPFSPLSSSFGGNLNINISSDLEGGALQ